MKDVDEFVKFLPSNDFFKAELALSYNDLGFHAALINSSITWYKMASYTTEDALGNKENICLRLSDVVTIQEEEYNESFAVIQSIFRHKANNNKYYAFIIVNWFEEINQKHAVLDCPLYRLLSIDNQRWRRIFPITVIDQVNKTHFVRNGNGEDYWMKNEFYFTAI